MTYHQKLLDFLLIAIALLLGLLLFLTQGGPPEKSAEAHSEQSLNAIQQHALIYEATQALSVEAREAIGFEGAIGSSPEDNLLQIKRNLIDPTEDLSLRFVWIALAISWDEDALAREAIVSLARQPDTLTTHQELLDALTRLASDLPAEDFARVETQLLEHGATPWLVQLLSRRQFTNQGDEEAAHAIQLSLRDHASQVASKWTWFFFFQGLLLPLLGIITLFVVPRRIRQRRRETQVDPGLPPTPFLTDGTARAFALWFIGFWLSGVFIHSLLGVIPNLPHPSLWNVALQPAFSTFLALWLIQRHALPPGTDLFEALNLQRRFPTKTVLKWLLPGLGFATVTVLASFTVNLTLLGREPDVQPIIESLQGESTILSQSLVFIGGVLFAPIAEEIVFRGLLYRVLKVRLSRALGMALSATLFAAVHFQPTLLIPLAGLGIALAILYEWTGTLWVPIIIHAAWNFLSLIQSSLLP